MGGIIIWSITVFGCAILFFAMGIYAEKREKPMWFWSGSAVDENKISDVRAYNKENANMWKMYSLWYWASGIVYFFKGWIGVVILVLGCTLGVGLLVTRYTKIEKKYTKK